MGIDHSPHTHIPGNPHGNPHTHGRRANLLLTLLHRPNASGTAGDLSWL